MLETISYRATRTLPPKPHVVSKVPTKLVSVNETLVKLANLANSPITYETILILELNQQEINITKIVNITMHIPSCFTSDIIEYGNNVLKNEQYAAEYVVFLKKIIASQSSLWEKYNEDIKFSFKVEKYLQQLNLMLHSENKHLQRYYLADS